MEGMNRHDAFLLFASHFLVVKPNASMMRWFLSSLWVPSELRHTPSLPQMRAWCASALSNPLHVEWQAPNDEPLSTRNLLAGVPSYICRVERTWMPVASLMLARDTIAEFVRPRRICGCNMGGRSEMGRQWRSLEECDGG